MDNHGNRYYLLICWEVGDSINNPTVRGHGGWNLHKARPDIQVDDQHICQSVHGGLFASQCIVTYTTQRAKINKPITWSVTATDIRVSLSWPVLATDNTSISQECAASSAKASNALLAINFSLNQQKIKKREKGCRPRKSHTEDNSLSLQKWKILHSHVKKEFTELIEEQKKTGGGFNDTNSSNSQNYRPLKRHTFIQNPLGFWVERGEWKSFK